MAILLLIFGLSSYYALSYSLYDNIDNFLLARMDDFKGALEQAESVEDIENIKALPNEMIYIYSDDASLLRFYGYLVKIPDIQGKIQKANSGESFFFNLTTDFNWNTRFYVSNAKLKENSNVVIIIGRFTNEIENVLARLKMILISTGVLVMILAGIGGFFYADSSLKPVEKIINTAKNIEENNLTERIKVNSQDELGRLASTLNQMISRLEKAFEQQKQFTADVSHDLRTPLSIIQAESSLTLKKDRSIDEYKKSLELILEETSYMSEIIDKLLFLARSDNKTQFYNFTKTNLKSLLEEVIKKVSPLYHNKSLTLQVEKLEELNIRADKDKLKEALINILDNSLKYTDEGKVTISSVKIGNFAKISIEDTGRGIPKEDLHRIFDRFYRGDKARTSSEKSTGLGLAIVKEIVNAHDGRIEVESEVGKGTVFSLFLPIEK
ncbi:integral membrane sensor signal transduction histidine kinase [Petrotoga mobilis SJ95]|uniref:histidine kinase n=2 Tax=Petrotoga TaxID=28236 RepID=A9BHG5_PETMO|nr:integral membrane sensor signal transduction histidine kinase [Petrotoga mobilis SJ95]